MKQSTLTNVLIGAVCLVACAMTFFLGYTLAGPQKPNGGRTEGAIRKGLDASSLEAFFDFGHADRLAVPCDGLPGYQCSAWYSSPRLPNGSVYEAVLFIEPARVGSARPPLRRPVD